MTIIEVANISAEVEWKNIKNVHLTIYPPNARVHVEWQKRLCDYS